VLSAKSAILVVENQEARTAPGQAGRGGEALDGCVKRGFHNHGSKDGSRENQARRG
jgi:hypothetical protein